MTRSEKSAGPTAGVHAREFAGEIREALPQDYARIAELAGQLGYPSSPDEIAKRLDGMRRSNEHAVFVAQLAGEIAGWLAVFVYRVVEADARAEISGFFVDERYRSQRVGMHLLARAERWAREKGCRAIGLRSNVIRDRAHTFYERHGYEHVKTQKSFRKDL
ncbi:MAG: GNAT family N-acetyltransferase [Candidatus Acidiferrales bacterium]